ncbi:MAG: hypothetical protein MJE68_31795 [Proteobacteria bacterium]|nr:hypothetical protein [Pseudomonadota bacterium]
MSRQAPLTPTQTQKCDEGLAYIVIWIEIGEKEGGHSTICDCFMHPPSPFMARIW